MRQGRELELLVSKIKALKLPEATIQSPEYVPDVDTGESREIDVGIRIKTDNGEIFIAVECRDRTAKQDVQWVEQLISKKESVGADLLLAVSSSSFSYPAVVKAMKRGVALRDIKYFDPDELHLWVDETYVQISTLERRWLDIWFVLDPAIKPTRNLDTYNFYLEDQDKIIQWQEFLSLVVDDNDWLEFGKQIPSSKNYIVFTVEVEVRDTSVIIPPKAKIKKVKCKLKAVRKIERIPLTSAYCYKDPIHNKEIAEGYAFGPMGAVAQVVTDLATEQSNVDIDFAALYPERRVIEYISLRCRKEIELKKITLRLGIH